VLGEKGPTTVEKLERHSRVLYSVFRRLGKAGALSLQKETPKMIPKKISAHEVVARSRDWERLAKQAEFKPAKLAMLCSISERQLQRIFKKTFNCTPRIWLRNIQCRLAKELIAHGYSTKAAAAELHFATEAHFCREFKKIFGASPQCFGPNQTGLFSQDGLATLVPADQFVQ
jgi:AraC-like DNA-binding protein